jgi:hypothetical protein
MLALNTVDVVLRLPERDAPGHIAYQYVDPPVAWIAMDKVGMALGRLDQQCQHLLEVRPGTVPGPDAMREEVDRWYARPTTAHRAFPLIGTSTWPHLPAMPRSLS